MTTVAAVAQVGSATDEMWRTSEFEVSDALADSTLPVSSEGLAVVRQVHRLVFTLWRHHAVIATASSPTAVRLAAPEVPDNWIALAQTVFPGSHSMTREERRLFERSFWSDAELLEFSDD